MGETLLWLAMAALTAAAAIAVIAPLLRASPAAAPGGDTAVYRDQLEELERERARGIIPEAEAAGARAEIGRRLLLAADRNRSAAPRPAASRTGLARALVLIIPAIALGLYLSLGSPLLPAQPLAARLAAPPETDDASALVARAEAELGRNPNRLEGWVMMAPIYMRLGRYADAATAYANVVRLGGATAERETMFGVALVGQAGGVVTGEARAAFDRALVLDPKYPQARISRALAREQEGDIPGAVAELKAVLADTPPADPLAEALGREVARIEAAPARGPSRADVANAADMAPEDQQAMVRGMVEGLSQRLAAQGGVIDEWLRLVRSYTVLGDADKAREAAATARKTYAADPVALAKLDALVASLGLGG